MGDDVRGKSPSTPEAALRGLDAVLGAVIDVFMLPNENRTIAMLDKHLQVCVPQLKSASLTVNRSAFIQKLHRLWPIWTHSLPPYISLFAQALLAKARFWTINSTLTSSSMLPIQHGGFRCHQKRRFALSFRIHV